MVALLQVALLGTTPAWARDPVVVVASEPDAPVPQQRLLEVLAGQLAELGVRVVLSTERAPLATDPAASQHAEGEVLAFVWIEGTPETVVVHFYEPAGTSLRERRIPATGTDAASLEEVAIVVRSAADALLERERGPRAPEVLPAPPAVSQARPVAMSPPPAPPRRHAPLEVAFGYVGGLYALELPWQNGARGRVAWRFPRSRLRLGAAAAWIAPARRSTESLTLVLGRTPLEAFAGYELAVGASRLAVGPEACVGGDVLRRRTEWASAALEGTPATTRFTGYVSTRLRLAWEPTPRTGFYGLAGAEFVLNRVEHLAGAARVIDPMRARPALEAGLFVHLP